MPWSIRIDPRFDHFHIACLGELHGQIAQLNAGRDLEVEDDLVPAPRDALALDPKDLTRADRSLA